MSLLPPTDTTYRVEVTLHRDMEYATVVLEVVDGPSGDQRLIEVAPAVKLENLDAVVRSTGARFTKLLHEASGPFPR